MTTRTKVIIAFSALGTLVVGLAVAIVAVLAAFTATSSSGVTVTYTAKNISARVKAYYHVCDNTCESSHSDLPAICTTVLQTTDNQNEMVFTGEETGETTSKSFKDLGDLEGNVKGICFYYEVTNTTDENILMQHAIAFENQENIITEMAYDTNEIGWMWGSVPEFLLIEPQQTLCFGFTIFPSEVGDASVVNGAISIILTRE